MTESVEGSEYHPSTPYRSPRCVSAVSRDDRSTRAGLAVLISIALSRILLRTVLPIMPVVSAVNAI